MAGEHFTVVGAVPVVALEEALHQLEPEVVGQQVQLGKQFWGM